MTAPTRLAVSFAAVLAAIVAAAMMLRAWLIILGAAAACWAFDVNRLVAAGCLFLASQSTAFIYFRF